MRAVLKPYYMYMKFVKGLCLFGLSFGLVFCTACFVGAETVSFASNPIWLSTTRTTEGVPVRVSTVVMKGGEGEASGTVTFYAGSKVIGSSEFSLPSSVGGAVVAVSFIPLAGTHAISAKINGDTTAEIRAKESLIIDPDNDRDAIADASDPDDDNDGVSDVDEKKEGTDPLKKPEQKGQVAGMSTSTKGLANDAKAKAASIGGTLFAQSEDWRVAGATYFDEKIADAEAQKARKQAELTREPSIDEMLVEPKPLMEQVSDASGMLETMKIQGFKALSFVFNNVYAFYIIIILFVLWLLRKFWRRHSLD